MSKMAKFIMVLGLMAALASSAQKPDAETATANLVGASEVIPIFFDPGMKALSKEEKSELQAMLTSIRETKKVESIKVLAWGDREYPTKKEKLQPKQVELAKDRADAIRNYLKNELKVETIETHNMAERPSKMSEFFKTSDAEVKATAEATGAAPTKKSVAFFEEMGRSTTALVLVVVK